MHSLNVIVILVWDVIHFSNTEDYYNCMISNKWGIYFFVFCKEWYLKWDIPFVFSKQWMQFKTFLQYSLFDICEQLNVSWVSYIVFVLGWSSLLLLPGECLLLRSVPPLDVSCRKRRGLQSDRSILRYSLRKFWLSSPYTTAFRHELKYAMK